MFHHSISSVCFCRAATICSDTLVSSEHFTQNLYVWRVFLQPSLLSGSTIYIFSNWVTSAQQQQQQRSSSLFFPFGFSKARATQAIWLHLLLTHPPPQPLYLLCLPVAPWTLFLGVLQQHRTGYKSHCIIAARCSAARFARPPPTTDWTVALLVRPLRAGHRCNHKSRLLPWGRWLGERGSPWNVNHAFCGAPRIQCCCLRCAECGATGRAAYQQTQTGAG